MLQGPSEDRIKETKKAGKSRRLYSRHLSSITIRGLLLFIYIERQARHMKQQTVGRKAGGGRQLLRQQQNEKLQIRTRTSKETKQERDYFILLLPLYVNLTVLYPLSFTGYISKVYVGDSEPFLINAHCRLYQLTSCYILKSNKSTNMFSEQ